MRLERGLLIAIVVSLALGLLPGFDWAFQLVYPLSLALGAVSVRWWPILIVLALPLWAALDYAIDPFAEGDSVDSAAGAAAFAALIAVPIWIVVFAIGKALRWFALVLGARNAPS